MKEARYQEPDKKENTVVSSGRQEGSRRRPPTENQLTGYSAGEENSRFGKTHPKRLFFISEKNHSKLIVTVAVIFQRNRGSDSSSVMVVL